MPVKVHVLICWHIKFADDSVIVSLLNKDNIHGVVVNDFNNWNERSFLNVNVFKIKELAIGFMKKPSPKPNYKLFKIFDFCPFEVLW